MARTSTISETIDKLRAIGTVFADERRRASICIKLWNRSDSVVKPSGWTGETRRRNGAYRFYSIPRFQWQLRPPPGSPTTSLFLRRSCVYVSLVKPLRFGSFHGGRARSLACPRRSSRIFVLAEPRAHRAATTIDQYVHHFRFLVSLILPFPALAPPRSPFLSLSMPLAF